MAIGERISFIRNLRGMTQKFLGLQVGFSERTADIRINRQNGSNFAKMTGLLEPWEEMAQKYRNGEINREDYDRWHYHYPKYDDTEIRASIPPKELSDTLVEALKSKLTE